MEWEQERFGFERLDLRLFRITVGWEKGSFYYSYLNVRSKGTFEAMEECKMAAEASAVRRLQAVIDLLNKR